MELITLLRQRRVWSAIVGMLALLLSTLHTQYQIDVPVLTDLLTSFGDALAIVIMSGLALHSHFYPKPPVPPAI